MPATLADIQAKYGDSVYPLYKDEMHEPYMEEENGIGYKGVVMYDELEQKVQCAECGRWFTRISSTHIKKCGKFETINEYKDYFGLNRNTPLCSREYSQVQADKIKYYNKYAKKIPLKVRQKQALASLVTRTRKPHSSQQEKNKHGLCEAQIRERLNVVRKLNGGKLTSGGILKFDSKLYSNLVFHFGNVKTFCKLYQIEVTGKGPKVDNISLIARLREFVINNKEIPTRDNGFVGLATCYRRFGSWRRAKMMAGLDQLLAEVKG